MIRPYGDYYFKAYVRGQRSLSSETYLFMIDGVVMNDLLFNSADTLSTLPISSVDRVEIVYGPATALYGPNAATGVINVITKSGEDRAIAGEHGVAFDSHVTFGGAQATFKKFQGTTEIFDATALYVGKDFRIGVGARFEDGTLDPAASDHFEYTKSKYYGDGRLWSSDLLSPATGVPGTFYSRDQKLSAIARLTIGSGTEVAGQFLRMSTGLGTVYPADRKQQVPYDRQEISVFARHRADLSSRADSTTLVQYRSSDALPSLNVARVGTDTGAVVESTTTASPTWGVLFTQDFGIHGIESLVLKGDALSLGTGLLYNHVELNRAPYGFSTLTCRRTDPATGDSADCPADPKQILGGDEHRPTYPRDTLGAYATVKYAFTPDQTLHLGGRLDFTSLKEELDPSFRGGYVGTFGDLVTVKALYGQAVYEPGGYESAQTLTEGAKDLEDERSQTVEGSVDLKLSWLGLHGGAYLVQVDHPLDVKADPVTGSATLYNLDSRMVTGADLGAQVIYKPLRVWAYYSRILTGEEVTVQGAKARPIGDIAMDKVWGGVTFDWAPLTATVMGRLMGPRTTVATNPLGEIPLHGTLDANVMLSDVLVHGLRFGLRVTNLLDTRYSHPGIWTADSGEKAGFMASDGTYTGSQGGFNSRLPQPGRSFFGTIGLTLDPKKGP